MFSVFNLDVSVPSEVGESVDMSKPMYWDRLDTPLPDRPYKEDLTAADKILKKEFEVVNRTSTLDLQKRGMT